jgi:hypothetical protein
MWYKLAYNTNTYSWLVQQPVNSLINNLWMPSNSYTTGSIVGDDLLKVRIIYLSALV